MSAKLPSKDEALEALDFIVNVLKEHEKDLDNLISELGAVAGQLGESSELNDKVVKIEEKINGLQGQVGNLVKYLSKPSHETKPIVTEAKPAKVYGIENTDMNLASGIPLLLQCRQWVDFCALASEAQTLSFSFKDLDKYKYLEVNALKGNRIITYRGEAPNFSLILKNYLSKQLEIAENQILDGEITLK